jgi:deoxyguanosinetriphosphate triphosphohydrolase, putative
MGSGFSEEAVYVNPLATLSAKSKGRLKPLRPDGYRTEFQRDIHRIIYSQPFRRLRHKTQVFFLPQNDHICTRMEHVLHVSSASRTVARLLQLNEDLAEAIGLGHDLGHAPFGHHGEQVLSEISREHGLPKSFQHEVHGLRVVDHLAELDRELDPGLNLTFEVRDGIISHCGERFDREITPYNGEKVLEEIKDRKSANSPATMEGCIVWFVDKIAYAGRDLEDALKAKLINEEDIPVAVTRRLGKNNGEIVGKLLESMIDYSRTHPDRIGLPEEIHAVLKELIAFNYGNIYKCPEVERFKKQATRAIRTLFDQLARDLEATKRFTASPELLPDVAVYGVFKKFIAFIGYAEAVPTAQIVLDFISGMTDNFVVSCLDQIYVPKNIT